jgi:predicted RNase H-like nuclease (RuvC/YqgF family)
VTALWFLQAGALSESKAKLEESIIQLDKTKAQIVAVQASADEQKLALMAECVKLEETTAIEVEKMNKIKGEVDAVVQTISDENATLALLKEENNDLPGELISLQEAKTDAEEKLRPMQQSEEAIKATRVSLEKQLAQRNSFNGGLQADLNALREKREAIQRKYEERSAELLKKVERPPWLYYGDKTRVAVMNVRPSMTGVFLPLGVDKGVKRGMEFLVRRINAATPTKRSWRFKLKIVQSDYCFAVIMPEFGDQNIPIRSGEEVELERSGNLAFEKVETEEKGSDDVP